MSKIRIYGDTSGYIDVAAPATADNSTLDLSTVAKTTGDITFTQESASSPYPEQKIKWSNDSTTANGFYVSQDADRNGRIWHEQGLDIKFGTTNTERMKIDYDGRVTMPYQPSFHAKGVQNRTSGAFTAFATIYHNIGNHFSGYTFTAPVSGVYQCNGVLACNGVTTGQWIGVAFSVNGVTVGQTSYQTASTSNDTGATVAANLYLNANDSLQLYAANQGSWTSYYSFSGHLVG